MPPLQPRRPPKSDGHKRLGEKLREIRERAGKSTREVAKQDGSLYASGHIANVEGGYATFPKSLLLAYSRLGGDYVLLVAEAERLRRSEAAGSNQPEPDDAALSSSLADPASPESLLRRGYAIDANEDTIHFGPDRVPVKSIHQVVIKPLLAAAKFVVCRYSYDDDRRPGVVTVDAISGCEIARLQESTSGVLDIVFAFDQQTLDHYGRCTLSWAVQYYTTIPADPTLIVGARTRVAHISKRVQFTGPALPSKIWWFRDTDPLRARVDPQVDQIIPLNSSAYYFHDFTDVETELCGLVWEWAK
ncbi:MAG: helix-turn-helix domain-containing protein [Acidobacteria bacterium]|nr:helix-turn-helix domain-containing protein [Acidobacteriota bacterium]